jgi:hypothetical protein
MLDSKHKILDSKNNILNSEMACGIKDSFYYNVPNNDCKQFNSGCSNKNNNSFNFDKITESGVANMKLLNSPGTERVLFSGFFGQQQTHNNNIFSSSFISSIQKENTNPNLNTIKKSDSPNKFIELVKAPIITNLNHYRDLSKDVSKISFSDLVRSVSIPSVKNKKSKLFF